MDAAVHATMSDEFLVMMSLPMAANAARNKDRASAGTGGQLHVAASRRPRASKQAHIAAGARGTSARLEDHVAAVSTCARSCGHRSAGLID